MTKPLAVDRRSDLVARLRAAGCAFAEEEADLLLAEAGTPETLAAMVARRVAGEPLEHVVGWAEFAGLRVAVGPGVFVPRRRTELLARHTLAALQARRTRPGDRPVLVELCCGAAPIGAAALAATEAVELFVSDLDPAALPYARRNVGAAGQVLEGDLDDALPDAVRGRVDVLAANAPYVPTAAIASMPPEARDHEPRTSLDGGPEGLAVLSRVIAIAPRWLAPGGHVLVESSQRQAPALDRLMREAGLASTVLRDDNLDATVVRGTMPPAALGGH